MGLKQPALKCPSCNGVIADETAWLCPYCEHILDPSFLGDDFADEAPAVPAEITGLIAWAPQASEEEEDAEVPDAAILGDDAGEADGVRVLRGADRSGAGRTATFLFYASTSTSRALRPDAIPVLLQRVPSNARTPYEDFVIACIDGQRDIRTIHRLSGLAEQEVAVTLLTLVDKKVIELRVPPSAADHEGSEDHRDYDHHHDHDGRREGSRGAGSVPPQFGSGWGDISVRPVRDDSLSGALADAFADSKVVKGSGSRPYGRSAPRQLADEEPTGPEELEGPGDVEGTADLEGSEDLAFVELQPLATDEAEEITDAVEVPSVARAASGQAARRGRDTLRGDELDEDDDDDPLELELLGDDERPAFGGAHGAKPSPRPSGRATSSAGLSAPVPLDPAFLTEVPPSGLHPRPTLPPSSPSRLHAEPGPVLVRGLGGGSEPTDPPPSRSPRGASHPVRPGGMVVRERVRTPVGEAPGEGSTSTRVSSGAGFSSRGPAANAGALPHPPDPDAFLLESHRHDDATGGTSGWAASNAGASHRSRSHAGEGLGGNLVASTAMASAEERARKPAGSGATSLAASASGPIASASGPAAMGSLTASPEPVDSMRMIKGQKLFEQALKDRAEGNLISARMNMKLAITFDPTNPLFQNAFEDISKNPDAAPRGGTSSRSRAREHYERATEAEAEGDVDRAIEHLEAAVKESRQPAFLNRLGVVLAMKKREYVRAQTLIEEAIELSPGNETYGRNLHKILSSAAAAGSSTREARGAQSPGLKKGLIGLLGKLK